MDSHSQAALRQVIRLYVDGEGVGYAERRGDRSRGGGKALAVLKDHGGHRSVAHKLAALSYQSHRWGLSPRR